MVSSDLRATAAQLMVIAERRELVTTSQIEIIADALSIAAEKIERLNARTRHQKTRYRHLKTGGIYFFECQAKDEKTGMVLAIYRNVATGECWARPMTDFQDGRFVAMDGLHDLHAE